MVLLAVTGWSSPAATTGASSTADPALKKVLILPVEPKGARVTRDMCELLTASITAEAGRLPGYRTLALKEVEGLIGQEQMRELAGCDAAGCAAELAGSLNVDEVVMGSLGTFGDNYLLTLTRIQSRTALVLGRSVQRFSGQGESDILDRLPSAVAETFGVTAPAIQHPAGTRLKAGMAAPAGQPRTSDDGGTGTGVEPGGSNLPWLGMVLVGLAGALLTPLPVLVLGGMGTGLGLVLGFTIASGVGDAVGIGAWVGAAGLGTAAGLFFLSVGVLGALKAWVL
jgi:hypothetical protein